MTVLVGIIAIILIERLFFYLLMKKILDILMVILESRSNEWEELEDDSQNPKTIKGFSDGQ